MFTIDLHMHTSYSTDGEIPPAQLVSMAKQAGLKYIAITDHNTTLGDEEALQEGERLGLTVIPGIEIDCSYDGLEIHLLGLNIDHQDRRYRDLWQSISTQEREASAARVRLVREMGIHLDDETVIANAKNGIVTGEYIAEVALADPRNRDNPLLLPFRSGGARDDNPFVNFYWDYCSPGKPGFVLISFMSLGDAVALVKDTGGVPVVAHPGQSLKGNKDKLPGILAEGALGIEAFSSYHSPEESEYWRKQAMQSGVMFTSGSDFHGKTKPAITLGGHGGTPWAEEIMKNLQANTVLK